MAFFSNDTKVISNDGKFIDSSFGIYTNIEDTEIRISPTDGLDSDFFGRSTAIGHNRVLIGAIGNDEFGTSNGMAYLYDYKGNLIKKFYPSVILSQFGYDVAIGNNKLYVTSSDMTNPTRRSVILDLEGNELSIFYPIGYISNDNDYYGSAIAAGCGRVVVGAYGDDQLGSNAGAAYIFNENGTQLKKITGLAAGDKFGQSVDVGHNRIVVGAPFGDTSYADVGSAYLYDLNGTLITELKHSEDSSTTSYFGQKVAIGCGRIVVSATGSYSAFVYDLYGNLINKITNVDPTGGTYSTYYGDVVVGNGNIIISDSYKAIYIYDLNGNFINKLISSDFVFGDRFGFSMDIKANKLVAGADYHRVDGIKSGSAYIYDLEYTYDTHIEKILE